MTIEPTITYGAILMAFTMVGGFISTIVAIAIFFTKMGGRIDLLALRVFGVEQKVEGISTIPSRVSVLEANHAHHSDMLASTQRRVDGLARGEGWITHPRTTVNGEHPRPATPV